MVIGSGAREHALAARLAADPSVSAVVCAPGNPGMRHVATIALADLAKPDSILNLAYEEHIDLTVVGPEAPLTIGVADRFTAAGLPIVGPSAAAARLESSKAFAKDFMIRHRVPTARFRTCSTYDEARKVVGTGEFGFPVVLKADGLAAGKGVVIAENRQAAEAAAAESMQARRFGSDGDRLVIEECLQGPEVSFFVLTDGRSALPIGSAQDHKRALDDDRGPNTGGMGAFAPSPLVDAGLARRVMTEIVDPVIAGMAAEGQPYRGFLYVGLMLTSDGPKVIEFNARLGDPEAQVILPLLDEPLASLLAASAAGELRQERCRFGHDKLVGVVLASRGYPQSSQPGQVISGIDAAERLEGVSVYHAGTALHDGQIVTSGGRVLSVVGRGTSFDDAIACAYAGVAKISFAGMQYRRDIGRKAIGLAIH
jgi:phosphoribosylamine--glycine ligase